MYKSHVRKKIKNTMIWYANTDDIGNLLAFFFFFFSAANIYDVEANKVNYGYEMEGVIFRKLWHLSLKQCHEECMWRKACKSYNYIQSVHLCELNHADKVNASANYTGFTKAVYGQKTDLEAAKVSLDCSSCGDHEVCERLENGASGCFIRECQNSPPVYNGAKALGNLNHVGAKVRYICIGNAIRLGNPVSQCNSTGNWSLPDFRCISGNCWTPDRDPKYHIINVTTDFPSVIMHVRCNENFTTRGSPIRCRDDGRYRYRDACCDSLDQNPWVRVFRSKSESGVGILALWSAADNINVGADGNTAKDCQFRRWDIISNWSTLDILKVKVDIKVNSSVSSWIIFNGQGSTYMDWFSVDRINSTSWQDLSTNTKTSLFSIRGKAQNDAQSQVLARFSIMESYSIDNCNSTSGWLMFVTRHQCFTASQHLQFAKGPSKATNAMEFQSADLLEIFVQFAN